MENKSSLGDWVFLIASVGSVAAYLGYENLDQINIWLATMQATANNIAGAADTTAVAWVASNWGLVALMVAVPIASAKWALSQRGGAVDSSSGPVVTYRRYKFIKVNHVR